MDRGPQGVKILLVMPRHREYARYFPFGLAYIHSTLKENGYDPDFIDCDYAHKDLSEMIPPDELEKYDVIGIGGLVSCYKTVKHDVVPYIRKNSKAVIAIGGYLGTSVPELLLDNKLCDIVFKGSGERSFLKFLDVYDDRDRWGGIHGVSFMEDRWLVDTGMGADKISETYTPFYKHMDMAAYNAHLPDGEKRYYLIADVGCPFSCDFCFNSLQKKCMNNRPPDDVVREISVAVSKYGYRNMEIMSENMLSNPKWVKEFCKLLDERGLKVRWSATGHANTLNDDILKLVKRHGCHTIGIGFENYSQKILDNMNKRTTVAQYVKLIRLMRKNKLEFTGTVIFGYFGEDDTTIAENAEFIKRYILPTRFFWIQAYPKTRLYEQAIERGRIKDEEAYIETLGDADDFSINLTEYSDDELKSKKAYLDGVGKSLRSPRYVLRSMRLYGVGWTAAKAMSYARNRLR